MSYKNVTTAFQKVGIFPLNKKCIPVEKTFPAEPFREKKAVEKVKAIKRGKEEVEKFLMDRVAEMQVENTKVQVAKTKGKEDDGKVSTKTRKPTAGGREITEEEFRVQLNEYEEEKKSNEQGKDSSRGKGKKLVKRKITLSPKPSTSGMCKKSKAEEIKCLDSENGDSDTDIEYDDSEKCCVCGRFSPKELRETAAFELVKWAKCTQCDHWVHLKYCTTIRCVRTQSC